MIRELTVDDWTQIEEVYQSHYRFMTARRTDKLDRTVLGILRRELEWSGSIYLGYFQEERLVAFVVFQRWRDVANYTVGISMTRRGADLPRHPDCHLWPLPLIELYNQGSERMYFEHRSTAWFHEPYRFPRYGDWMPLARHPGAVSKDWEREEILFLPQHTETKVPETLWNVFNPGLPSPSRIVKYTNPEPLPWPVFD